MDVFWRPQTLKAQSHLTSAQKGTSCSSHIPYAATMPGTPVVFAAPLATLRLQLTSVSSVSRRMSPVRIRVLSSRGEVGPVSVALLQSYPPHLVSPSTLLPPKTARMLRSSGSPRTATLFLSSTLLRAAMSPCTARPPRGRLRTLHGVWRTPQKPQCLRVLASCCRRWGQVTLALTPASLQIPAPAAAGVRCSTSLWRVRVMGSSGRESGSTWRCG